MHTSLAVGLALLLAWATPAYADEPAPVDVPALAQDPGAAVHAVFVAHCARCHGSGAHPKGEFGHILDLDRLGSDARYVMARSPTTSPLYDLVTKGKMPPPEAKAPALSEAEIETIRTWIESGATRGGAPGPEAIVELPAVEKTPSLLIGQLHPLVVHFPIVLLLSAVLLEVLASVKRTHRFDSTARACLWLGTLGASMAVLTGWLWAASEGYDAHLHRWLAVGATLCALGASVMQLRISETTGLDRWLYRLALLLTLALIILTGHHGGTITHGPTVLP